jgi:hypothetical protein
MMQKVSWSLVLILFFSVAAAAQQTPRFEVFGGYSHLFTDLNDSNFNMDGFHFSAAENLNKWLGGVADFSSDYGKQAGLNINTQSVMYGPRVSARQFGAVVPSVHALFGVTRGSAGFLGISKADTHFSMGFGGELDIKINKYVSYRVVQGDYIVTHFLNLRQDNVRVSTGLVFRIPRW